MTDQPAPALHRAARVAFVLYLLVLAAAAFLPLPSQTLAHGTGAAYDLHLRRPDLLGGWEAQRNVLMTVPFGVLLPLVVRWRYELLVLACVGVTVLIESVQLLVSLAVGWPWRSFDVNDLLLNTVGGLLGLALAGAALAVVRRPALPAGRRLVPGALAVGLVGWAAVSTVTATPAVPLPEACAQGPAGAVTALSEGEVFAGDDGSLCFVLASGTADVPANSPAGPVVLVDDSTGTWEVGTAPAGARDVRDGRGAPVELLEVEGSPLRVWESRW
ncbi:VanZ family protein [Cellulomonas telluris]|uniref:VanZ family protein n=1 Tax=Cellulomonas telluris TaxID=2306636 RepID=UPI0014562B90|nr:VanZ family protein [Cellulomonas telluris]